LAIFGFGIIGLESSEIGSSTPTAMPKEETLVVNKDLSNILKFQGGGQQIFVFATIHLELKEGSMKTKEKNARI